MTSDSIKWALLGARHAGPGARYRHEQMRSVTTSRDVLSMVVPHRTARATATSRLGMAADGRRTKGELGQVVAFPLHTCVVAAQWSRPFLDFATPLATPIQRTGAVGAAANVPASR